MSKRRVIVTWTLTMGDDLWWGDEDVADCSEEELLALAAELISEDITSAIEQARRTMHVEHRS